MPAAEGAGQVLDVHQERDAEHRQRQPGNDRSHVHRFGSSLLTRLLAAAHRPRSALGQALLDNGLLDELRLWIHPLFVGRGTLLFRPEATARLRLVGTETRANGVVVVTYEPGH